MKNVRSLVRALFLGGAILLLLPQARTWNLAYLVPAASPQVALASIVSTHSLGVIAIPGLFVGVIVLIRRRWFCRWACPTGLLADLATRTGRRAGRRCPHWPPVGQWIAVITLGGACLGYPMLLWLDPLALFSSSFGVGVAMSATAVCLSLGGMLLLLVSSLLWPGIWCHRVCPLGAAQDLLARFTKITGPSLKDADRPAPGAANPGMSRRFALGTLVGLAWGCLAQRLIASAGHRLRPPGALDDGSFVGVCVRCGNCTRACPTRIITPDISPAGVAGLLAPVVTFADDYCREDCTRCMDVCPSGALQRIAVQDKITTRMGTARVDMDVCLLAEDRECSACRNNCPFEAITYVWSDVDYMLTPRIDPARCPGCGACQVACPTQPAKAIVVLPDTGPLPSHRNDLKSRREKYA